MAITGRQPKAYNSATGLEDDVFFPANMILFEDGFSFQQKFDSGELRGQIGPQGIQGEQGTQGIQGPVGPAASITIKVKKNEAGGMPTVEQEGDSENGYIITIGVPEGLKGDTGATGEPGVTPTIDTSVDVITAPSGSNATASLVKRDNNSYHLTLTIPQGERGADGEDKTDTIVDDFMSDISINPVRNNVIKAYIDKLYKQLVDSAPEALNTLRELATALGDDKNFAATITTNLAAKVDKVPGQSLSDENFTLAEKEKLAGIEPGSEKNVVYGVKGTKNDEYSTNYISLDASDVGASPETHTHNGGELLVGDTYTKESGGDIEESDSITKALGKLQYGHDTNAMNISTLDTGLAHSVTRINDLEGAIGSLNSDTFEQANALRTKQDIVLGEIKALEETQENPIESTDSVKQALLKLQARIDWLTSHVLYAELPPEQG